MCKRDYLCLHLSKVKCIQAVDAGTKYNVYVRIYNHFQRARIYYRSPGRLPHWLCAARLQRGARMRLLV